MLILDIAVAIIIMATIYTISLGYKALTMAISFWKKHGAKAEERDRNNAIFYRDFMGS